MTLEDFERSLLEERQQKEKIKTTHKHEKRKHHSSGKHRHEDREDYPGHKRRRHLSRDGAGSSHRESKNSALKRISNASSQDRDPATFDPTEGVTQISSKNCRIQRDSWMEEPSGLEIDYTQKGVDKDSDSPNRGSINLDFDSAKKLNGRDLPTLAHDEGVSLEAVEKIAEDEIGYRFGDSGSQWRMTKLKGVYRRAEESGRPIDAVAEEQFGNLRAFDDAREEQVELDREKIYGEDYVGKDRPSGELFEERKLDIGSRSAKRATNGEHACIGVLPRDTEAAESATVTVSLDQTALNRLKAQMLKAKVRGSSDATTLEVEYNEALATFANRKQADVVVLGAMHNRMLAGSREGEVNNVDNKRGRDRGLVEENENMSIEDMVKQERRMRNEIGGDGQRFAERIAKDAKFDVRNSLFQTIGLLNCFAE